MANKIDNLRGSNNKRILGAITVGSILKTINTYVSLASTVLASIAGISLLVSALMIIVTMYMSVSERTKEIGILRALGERKKIFDDYLRLNPSLLDCFPQFSHC